MRVRITGNPALSSEEMVGFAWDIGIAGSFCFVLVALLLYAALRSVKLVIAAIVTLLAGLIWTAAFASLSVGSLNLVSLSFGILLIGLGVDFAIHLGMGYADLLRSGHSHEEALQEAAGRVGAALSLLHTHHRDRLLCFHWNGLPRRRRAGSDRRLRHVHQLSSSPSHSFPH